MATAKFAFRSLRTTNLKRSEETSSGINLKETQHSKLTATKLGIKPDYLFTLQRLKVRLVSLFTSPIDDSYKIISKSQQNAGIIQNDICILISGSKFGDLIILKFVTEVNLTPSKMLQKQQYFIHQDMQLFFSCSQDGTTNLNSLPRLELLCCL